MKKWPTCSNVTEVVEGKDYAYCEKVATLNVAGNVFCADHAIAVDRTIRVQALIEAINQNRP